MRNLVEGAMHRIPVLLSGLLVLACGAGGSSPADFLGSEASA